jgi:hypothetical protein
MHVRLYRITITVLVAVLLFYGCGKVGDPIPPGQKAFQAIPDIGTHMEKDREDLDCDASSYCSDKSSGAEIYFGIKE